MTPDTDVSLPATALALAGCLHLLIRDHREHDTVFIRAITDALISYGDERAERERERAATVADKRALDWNQNIGVYPNSKIGPPRHEEALAIASLIRALD